MWDNVAPVNGLGPVIRIPISLGIARGSDFRFLRKRSSYMLGSTAGVTEMSSARSNVPVALSLRVFYFSEILPEYVQEAL